MKIAKIGKQGMALTLIFAIVLQVFPFTVIAESMSPVNTSSPAYDVTEILIKYKDPMKKPQVDKKIRSQKLFQKFTVTSLEHTSDYAVVDVHNVDNMEEQLQKLQQMENVAFASPNYKLYPYTDATAAPLYPPMYFQEAQAIASAEDIVIGVLDTGIDITHPALSGHIYTNTVEQIDCLDTDDNGYPDDIHGWDFAAKDGSVFDNATADEHGTAVAGILAEALPQAKLLPLKFINGDVGYTADAIEAIAYAEAMGVRIMNCSFGGPNLNFALKDAMENSRMLFICAAGKAGDSDQSYPAGYGLSNIISVGAADTDSQPAISNNSGTKIDLFAPGIQVLSLKPNGGKGVYSGTSMAAPYVSAAAGLLLSQHPDIKMDILKLALTNGSKSSNQYLNVLEADKQALVYRYLQNGSESLRFLLQASCTSLTPDMAELFNRNQPLRSLSEEQRENAAAFFGIRSPIGQSLPLDDSLFLSFMKERFGLSESQLLQGYAEHTASFVHQLTLYTSYVPFLSFSAEDRTAILSLLLQGYTMDTVVRSWIASQALEVPIETYAVKECLAPANITFDEKEAAALSYVAASYFLEPDHLQVLCVQRDLTPSALQTQITLWETAHRISLSNTALSPNASRPTYVDNGLDIYRFGEKPSWSYDMFSIDKATGEASYQRPLVAIPNSALNLGIRFDPEVSEIQTKTKDFSAYERINVSVTDICHHLENGEWVPDYNDQRQTNYTASFYDVDAIIRQDHTSLPVDSVTKYIRYILPFSNVPSGTSVEESNPNYYNSLYHLGAGWAFTLPSIEKGRYLHLEDGRKELILNGAIVSQSTSELTLQDVSGATGLPSLSRPAKYCVQNLSDDRFFFAEDGRYLGKVDSNGNLSTVTYDSQDRLSRLIDFSGRYLEFIYDAQGNMSLYLNDSPANGTARQLLWQFTMTASSSSNPSSLSKITDSQNAYVEFGYEVQNRPILINAFADTASQTIPSDAVSLTYVKDFIASKLNKQTNLQYETATKAYGMASKRQYARVAKSSMNGTSKVETYTYGYVNDQGQFTTSNSTLFRYSHLFYPLNTSYRGLNSVTRSYVREEYMFDASYYGLRTDSYSRETDLPHLEQSVVCLERDSRALPTKIKTITYSADTADQYLFTQQNLSWDSYGNPVSQETVQGYKKSGQTEYTSPLILDKAAYTYDYTASKTAPVLSVSLSSDNNKTIGRHTYDAKGRLSSSTTFHAASGTAYAANQIRYTYNAKGQMTASDTYEFSGSPIDIAETDLCALTNSRIYPDSVVTGFADARHSESRYGYDVYNNEASVQYLNVRDADGQTETIQERKEYDFRGLVLKSYEPEHLSDVQQPGYTGLYTSYTYNSVGEVTKTVEPNGAETTYMSDIEHGYGSVISSPLAYKRYIFYDDLGRSRGESVGDYWNFMTTRYYYTYDDQDNIIQNAVFFNNYNNEWINTYEYSWDGRLTHLREDLYGNISEGYLRTLKEQTITIHPAVPYGDQLCTEAITEIYVPATADTPRKLLRKSAEYTDASGAVIGTKQYYSESQYYTDAVSVDAYQKVSSVGGETIPHTQYYYDTAGRQDNVTCGYTLDKDHVRTENAWKYDGFDRKTAEGSAVNYQETGLLNDDAALYEYDELGRQIVKKIPFGVVNDTLVYSVEKTYYDARGNITEKRQTTNALGEAEQWRVTRYVYDAVNNLIQIDEQDGAAHAYTQYAYDLAGQCRYVYSGLTAPLQITASYADSAMSFSVTPGTDTSYSVEAKEYDLWGHMVCRTDPAGVKTYYEYDTSRELLLKEYQKTAQGTNIHVITYTYDEQNNLISKQADGVTQTFTYDAAGQQLTADDGTFVITNTYDLLGRLLSEEKGNSEAPGLVDSRNEYTYSGVGKTSQKYFYLGSYLLQEVCFSYDNQNRLSLMDTGGEFHSPAVAYNYDARGLLSSKNRYGVGTGGVGQSYTYTLAGQVHTIEYAASNGALNPSVRSIEAYTYNLDGNVSSKLDFNSSHVLQNRTSYQYDGRNRLKKETVERNTKTTGGQEVLETTREDTYSFDENSNIKKKDSYNRVNGSLLHSETVYTYNTGNQLLTALNKLYAPSGSYSTDQTSYLYDDRGNLSQVKNNAGIVKEEYLYDGLNRTKQVTTPNRCALSTVTADNQTTTYTYDAYDRVTGRSIQFRDPSGSNMGTHYWGNNYMGGVITNTWFIENNYQGGWRTNYYIADSVSNSPEFCLNFIDTDHPETGTYFCLMSNTHGDTTFIASKAEPDPGYESYQKYDCQKVGYTAYGTPDYTGIEVLALYAAQQYNYESGLYYMGARLYNPSIGRFTQEDTYWGSSGDPSSYNLYAYCGGNPIAYSDPSGHWRISGNTAIAEEDDTLWGLAARLTGKGANWTKLGFKRDPRTLQIGEKINISIFNNPSRSSNTSAKKPQTNSSVKKPVNPPSQETVVNPSTGEDVLNGSDLSAWWDKAVGALLTAGASIGGSAAALGGLIASMPLWLTSSAAQKQPVAIAKTDAKSLELIKKYPRHYFGVALVNDIWTVLTGPMTDMDSITWAQLSAASGMFSPRKSSWGIYSPSMWGAFHLATLLGGGTPVGPEVHGPGQFWHYHPMAHRFGNFRHFHIWFGVPTI